MLTQCPILQIEDLSQQVHKAAAEKFKVPSESLALVPELAPGPQGRTECEEQEEDDEEVGSRGSGHLTGGWGQGEGWHSTLPGQHPALRGPRQLQLPPYSPPPGRGGWTRTS